MASANGRRISVISDRLAYTPSLKAQDVAGQLHTTTAEVSHTAEKLQNQLAAPAFWFAAGNDRPAPKTFSNPSQNEVLW